MNRRGSEGDEAVSVAMAAVRDASWPSNPGRGYKYHIIGATPRSACGVALSEFTDTIASSVPEYMRCQRAACLAAFQDADRDATPTPPAEQPQPASDEKGLG
jgi:hypothetical protein